MKKNQRGSFLIKLIFIGAVAGGLHYYKDSSGVSYLQKAYTAARYYTVDRNDAAMNDAKGVQKLMQQRQDEIQEGIDGQ